MPLFLHDGALHLFAAVPKTGGASVTSMLRQIYGPLLLGDPRYYARPPHLRWSRTSPQHLVAEDLLRFVAPQHIATSFALVRHPVSRLVSAYRHAVQRDAIPAGTDLETWLKDYVALRERRPFAFDNHLRPQVAFLLPETRVFRLENGHESLHAWLQETYGGAFAKIDIPHVTHRTDAPPPDVTLQDRPVTGALRRLAEDVYGEDFERFGYSSGDGPDSYPMRVHATRNPLSRSRLRRRAYRVGVAWRGLPRRFPQFYAQADKMTGAGEW